MDKRHLVTNILFFLSHLYACSPSAPLNSRETSSSPMSPSREVSARDRIASFISYAETSCATASVVPSPPSSVPFPKERMI